MIPYDKHREAGFLKSLRQSINQLKAGQRSLRIANGANYHVKRTAIGTVLDLRSTTRATDKAFVVKRTQVIEVKSTYLVCQDLLPDNQGFTGGRFSVLRPFETLISGDTWFPSGTTNNQTTSTDSTGADRTRQLTWDKTPNSFSADQKIYPEYVGQELPGLGSLLYVTKNIGNLGGRTIGEGHPVDADGNHIDWIDLNVDARHWAWDIWREAEVCVNNETKKIYVMASTVGEP